MEIVPQHTSRVFDHADVSGDVRFVILHQRHTLVFPGLSEEGAHVIKPGEAPVSFVGGESMGCD